MNGEPKDDAATDDVLVAVVRGLAEQASCLDERAFATVLQAWLAARYAGREREMCEHLRPWVQALGDEASDWMTAHERRN